MYAYGACLFLCMLCGDCGNVSCVVAVVKYSGVCCHGVLKYIVCLCK